MLQPQKAVCCSGFSAGSGLGEWEHSQSSAIGPKKGIVGVFTKEGRAAVVGGGGTDNRLQYRCGAQCVLAEPPAPALPSTDWAGPSEDEPGLCLG